MINKLTFPEQIVFKYQISYAYECNVSQLKYVKEHLPHRDPACSSAALTLPQYLSQLKHHLVLPHAGSAHSLYTKSIADC